MMSGRSNRLSREHHPRLATPVQPRLLALRLIPLEHLRQSPAPLLQFSDLITLRLVHPARQETAILSLQQIIPSWNQATLSPPLNKSPACATYPAQISPSSRLSDQTGQQMRADPNRPPAGPAPVLHRPGISPPYPPVAHEQQQQTPGSRDYSDRRSPGQGSVDSWRSTSTTGLFYETALFSLRILLYQS